jgi:hypothetical protein
LLIAHFARKLTNTRFLVEFDRDGLLVVAEEAGEDSGERLVLREALAKNILIAWLRVKGYLFLALRLLGGLLAFTLCYTVSK